MSRGFQSAVATATGPAHHPVFHRFPCWEGKVSEGFVVNFLGVITRTSYWKPYIAISDGYPVGRYVTTCYPPFDEEYFEWIDLLESVVEAQGHFTMLELGAGWSRWTANAAAALKSLGGLPYTFIAVEAEPTHFRWMARHLSDNAVDVENVRPIQAAVAGSAGMVGFHVGETEFGGPSNWYGQSIGGPDLVEAVSLGTLLQPLTTVDLIDLDVQGAELEVLEAAAGELDEKVKRVHIGTHGRRIEEGLLSLFGRLGWKCVRSFSSAASVETEWGTISFQDGVQSWLNPAFSHLSGNTLAALREKLAASRREGARLWAELEGTREEWDQAQIVKESRTWKIIDRGKRMRDRLAPGGTRRRMIYDFIAKKI